MNELKNRFEETVNMYLEHCLECEIEPKKPFSGLFRVRINPSLHQKVALKAKEEGVSINSFIKQALEHKLNINTSL